MQTKLIACVCASAMLLLVGACNNQGSGVKDSSLSPLPDPLANQSSPTDLLTVPIPLAAFAEAAMQHFEAAAGTQTIITAKGGLRVKVNPAVLESEDGQPVKGTVRVSVLELTSSQDLFKANAATISNGRLLVSGGSYYVGMESEGKKLRIRKGDQLEMEFPRLKNDGMQLFYGNRDEQGNMNWGQPVNNLQTQYTIINTANSDWENSNQENYGLAYARAGFPKRPVHIFIPHTHLFSSVGTKVFFQDRSMSIREMVNILQQKGVDKILDTVYGITNRKTRKTFYKLFLDEDKTDYDSDKYWKDTSLFFRIIPSQLAKTEKDSVRQVFGEYQQKQLEARARYEKLLAELKIERPSLSRQLALYYAPAGVTELGWINCDHFYDRPCDADIPISMSNDFRGLGIQYFIIYRAFNGLISGTLDASQTVLKNMPAGEPVTLVGFVRKGDIIYQFRKDFTTEKNKPVEADFKEISAEEITKMFGKNAVI